MKQSNKKAVIGLYGLAAVFLLVLTSVTIAAPTQQSADIEKVRQGMSKLLSGRQVDSITPSPISGLYEVLVGPQLYYVSADGKYLFSGKLFDINSREDLTTPKVAMVKADAIEQMGEENMVIFSPKEYEHTVTVFTDIDCGYCRKLHDEIDQYNDLGIRVRYLMFPRAGVGSPAYQKAVNVFCADDKNDAMTRAKAGKDVEERQCENSVAEQYALGQKVGVTGTPAIFLTDGELVPGYVPAAKMQAILKERSR
ncbi:MAG: thioredoxin fold domain-containing protein [Candidatus Thiodiazotropha sp. (ex Myrtea spinifera)]|nr:thioredoxin fold domain-containing protein [Candidatus Thiodiazotropha sp. (ex Myrtea spinifera)]MCU7829095.1 thioredoxin fold domain-containing protein [Candidatus Thiodiazotropha sp. (ex Myrtea sp. 'scaly one' KF741663)]